MGRLAPDSLSYPHQAANVMPGGKIKAPGASAPGAFTRTSWGNDKGLYATMNRWRIDKMDDKPYELSICHDEQVAYRPFIVS